MGNCISCYFPGSSKAETANLFDPQGTLQRLELPLKAAELMLEQPGHAIAPVEELHRTRRISALKADDELSAGKDYILVPWGRVHSKVSELEMAIIELACKKRAARQKPSGSKVSPAAMTMESREVGEEEVEVSGLPIHPVGNHRRWSPVLEPISEAF